MINTCRREKDRVVLYMGSKISQIHDRVKSKKFVP
jgi:hypothetical protein